MARIIHVDDYDSARGLVSAILNPVHDVLSFSDATRALDSINLGVPDLLITDGNMQPLDGYGLINELGSRGYDFPVIFNSGDSFDSRKVVYTGTIFDLPKPLNIASLRNAVKIALD